MGAVALGLGAALATGVCARLQTGCWSVSLREVDGACTPQSWSVETNRFEGDLSSGTIPPSWVRPGPRDGHCIVSLPGEVGTGQPIGAIDPRPPCPTDPMC